MKNSLLLMSGVVISVVFLNILHGTFVDTVTHEAEAAGVIADQLAYAGLSDAFYEKCVDDPVTDNCKATNTKYTAKGSSATGGYDEGDRVLLAIPVLSAFVALAGIASGTMMVVGPAKEQGFIGMAGAKAGLTMFVGLILLVVVREFQDPLVAKYLTTPEFIGTGQVLPLLDLFYIVMLALGCIAGLVNLTGSGGWRRMADL